MKIDFNEQLDKIIEEGNKIKLSGNMKEIKINKDKLKEEIETFDNVRYELQLLYNKMINLELLLSDYEEDIDFDLVYDAVDSIADLRKAINFKLKELKEGE